MRKAFTLIELLVVIAIIAILAAILFPVFAQAKESAKDAAALTYVKQHGLAAIMYGSDFDDAIHLNLRIEGSSFDTWQGMCQPYMKNWGIMAHPKLRALPSDTSSAAWYYQARSHWASPLRAQAHGTAAPFGYYYFQSTSMTGGLQYRFDGVSGYGGPANAWGVRIPASSLTYTQVARPADTLLICEGGMWDHGMGFVGAQNPFNYFWLNGTWVNPALNVFATTNYIGPHARKRKVRCSGGDDPKAASGFPDCLGALPWPDGMTTLVAVDGHATGVNWRGGITGRINDANNVPWMKWHAPQL
ncbi:MAG: prepilin-type N-terminal cleavage/methylation domain-containing protein [Fimbriimonadaceae bacterium]|nr:prepilin-type N-terminal cleavage/methylation domain-containing protein [Fimbriimonadaceae bacterium]